MQSSHNNVLWKWLYNHCVKFHTFLENLKKIQLWSRYCITTSQYNFNSYDFCKIRVECTSIQSLDCCNTKSKIIHALNLINIPSSLQKIVEKYEFWEFSKDSCRMNSEVVYLLQHTYLRFLYCIIHFHHISTKLIPCKLWIQRI